MKRGLRSFGTLGREWEAWMPQSIEALSGSCVLIPCRFEIRSEYDSGLTPASEAVWKKGGTGGRAVFRSSRTETTPAKNEIDGTLIGNLLKKDCTTILDRFPLKYSDTYFFRVEGSKDLMHNFAPGVKINVKDSPPKPKLTPKRVEVIVGTSVSLSCSAAAPCPKLPPNLTWIPSLNDSVDQLLENEDQTKSVSSVLTFTASHLHHGQKITCRALYTLQQGDVQKTSEASLTLTVLYPPKDTSISPSGSVLLGSSVTLTCSSKANPPVQDYTWYKVNGTETITVGTGQNLTINVTESSDSEQYYCEARNELGKENSTVQLNVIYVHQIFGSGSCSRTAAETSCSCESRGNPSPSMEWHVSGLRVANSTDRVIREEQLGNTGLRSSLTMRHSQGDTPTILCLSSNTLGSSSLQLHIPSPQQHSGLFSTGLLVIGVLAGALTASLLWGVALCLNQKIAKDCSDGSCQLKTREETEKPTSPAPAQCEQKPSLGPPAKSSEDLYANHLMVARKKREREEQSETDARRQTQMKTQSQAAEYTLHYASVKFTARKSDPEAGKSNQEAATVTSPVYDNASRDINRKNCSSNDFDPPTPNRAAQ